MEAQDGEHGHVALVNETFARFFFPHDDAVGKYFRADTVPLQIIGVINDVRDHTLRRAAARRYYLPYLRAQEEPEGATFELRTRGDPARVAPDVRRIAASIDPRLINSIDPLTTLTRESVRYERLLARLASGFGVGALLLAAIGLYGMMNYAVTRRTGEIGLRLALGARREGVVGLVVTDALRVVMLDFVLGIPAALGLLTLLRGELYGVQPTDPISLATTLIVLLVSALLAVVPAAVRASRVSPMVALREDYRCGAIHGCTGHASRRRWASPGTRMQLRDGRHQIESDIRRQVLPRV